MSDRDAWFMFDAEVTTAETERYRVRIRTGMSILARNRIVALGRQAAAERAALWALLMQQASQLREGMVSSATLTPGVMEHQPFAYWVESQQRTITLALVWGFVARGVQTGGKRRGDFIFGIVADEQVEQAAQTLFHTRKVKAA